MLPSSMINKKLFEAKKQVAANLTKKGLSPAACLNLTYHEIPLAFYAPPPFLEALREFLPSSWQKQKHGDDDHHNKERLHISLHSPEEFKFAQEEWEDESCPDCLLWHEGAHEYAMQRDFVGMDDGNQQISIICSPHLDDGFYNALRWCLPRKMLLKNKIVLHSSCVITADGSGKIFFGPSGAGKTTITQLAGERRILGDDMNIISFEKEVLYVEAAAMGSRHDITKVLGEKFPVSAFYSPIQSARNQVQPISTRAARPKLVQSCANLFLEYGQDDLAANLLQLTKKILKTAKFYNLEFTKSEEFWPYVET